MHAQAYRDDGWERYVEEILHTGKHEHNRERAELAPVAVGDVVLLAQVLDGLQLAHTRRHSDALSLAPAAMQAYQGDGSEKDDEQHNEDDDETSVRLCLPSPSPCGDTSPPVAPVLRHADVGGYDDDYKSPVDASMPYGVGFGEPGDGGGVVDESVRGTIAVEATQREGNDEHVHERERSAFYGRDSVYSIHEIRCGGGDDGGEVGRRGEERRSRNDGQCRTLVDSPPLHCDGETYEPGSAESVGTRAAAPPHKRPHLSLGNIVPATPDPFTPPYFHLPPPPPPPPPPRSPPHHPPTPEPVQTASGTPYGRMLCGGSGVDDCATQTTTPEHIFTQTQVEPSTAMSVDRPATVHSNDRHGAEQTLIEGTYNKRGSPNAWPGSPHDRTLPRGLLFSPVFAGTATGHSQSPLHSEDHTQRDDGSSVCSNADMMSLSSVLGSAPTPSPDDIQADRDQRHLCEMMRMLVSPPAASPSSPMSLALSTDDTPTSLRRTNRRLTFHSPPPPAPPRSSPAAAASSAAATAADGSVAASLPASHTRLSASQTALSASHTRSSASHTRWPSLTPQGHDATMITEMTPPSGAASPSARLAATSPPSPPAPPTHPPSPSATATPACGHTPNHRTHHATLQLTHTIAADDTEGDTCSEKRRNTTHMTVHTLRGRALDYGGDDDEGVRGLWSGGGGGTGGTGGGGRGGPGGGGGSINDGGACGGGHVAMSSAHDARGGTGFSRQGSLQYDDETASTPARTARFEETYADHSLPDGLHLSTHNDYSQGHFMYTHAEYEDALSSAAYGHTRTYGDIPYTHAGDDDEGAACNNSGAYTLAETYDHFGDDDDEDDAVICDDIYGFAANDCGVESVCNTPSACAEDGHVSGQRDICTFVGEEEGGQSLRGQEGTRAGVGVCDGVRACVERGEGHTYTCVAGGRQHDQILYTEVVEGVGGEDGFIYEADVCEEEGERRSSVRYYDPSISVYMTGDPPLDVSSTFHGATMTLDDSPMEAHMGGRSRRHMTTPRSRAHTHMQASPLRTLQSSNRQSVIRSLSPQRGRRGGVEQGWVERPQGVEECRGSDGKSDAGHGGGGFGEDGGCATQGRGAHGQRQREEGEDWEVGGSDGRGGRYGRLEGPTADRSEDNCSLLYPPSNHARAAAAASGRDGDRDGDDAGVMTLATQASPPPSERVSMCAAGRQRAGSSFCAQPHPHLPFDADEHKQLQPRHPYPHTDHPHGQQQQQHGQSGATCRGSTSPPPPFSPDLLSGDHDPCVHAYDHDDTQRHTRGMERRSSIRTSAHKHTTLPDDHNELCHSQHYGGGDSDTQTSSDHEGARNRRSSLRMCVCTLAAASPLSPDLLLMGAGREGTRCDGHRRDDDDDDDGGSGDEDEDVGCDGHMHDDDGVGGVGVGDDEDDEETCMPWDGGRDGDSRLCGDHEQRQERDAYDVVGGRVAGGRGDCCRGGGGSDGGDRRRDRGSDGVNGARRRDANTSTVLEILQHCGSFQPSAMNGVLPTSREHCDVEHGRHRSLLQIVHSDVHREGSKQQVHSTDNDHIAVLYKDVEAEDKDGFGAGQCDTRQEEDPHASEPMGIVTRGLRRLSLEEDQPAPARPGQLQLKRRRHRADTDTDGAPRHASSHASVIRRSSEAKRLREWMTEREQHFDAGWYACGRQQQQQQHRHHREMDGHDGGIYLCDGGGRSRRLGGDDNGSGGGGDSGRENDDDGGAWQIKGRKAGGTRRRRRPLASLDLNDNSTYASHPLPISGGVIVMVTPGPEDEQHVCTLCMTTHGSSDPCLGVSSHATLEKTSQSRGRRRAVETRRGRRGDACGGGGGGGGGGPADAAAAEGAGDHRPVGPTSRASPRAANKHKQNTPSIFHRFLHSASKTLPPSALPTTTPVITSHTKPSSHTATTTPSSSAAPASRSIARTTPRTFITALLPHLANAPLGEGDHDGPPMHPCCHFVGGTLVVTSRAGLKVWEEALRGWRRTTGGDVDGPSFIVYSMGARDRSMLPPRTLSHAAIVLTTYEILQAKEVSLRRPVAAGGWLDDLHDNDDGTRSIVGSRLMLVEWRRLVVDEGQRVGRANSASAALAKVHARRRWLLLDWEAVVIGSSRAAAKAGISRGAWGPSDDLKVMGLLRAVWASSIPDHDFTWPDLVATSAAVGLFRIGGVRGV